MQFWAGWEMWQKLCFVLAVVLVIVLIYSFCVLLYNRRNVRKHAAAEAVEKAEQGVEAELHPMLTRSSDIPFGARALQRGVQIEGIWVSSNESLDQIPKQPAPAISPPSTPITGSPLKKTSVVETSENQDSLPKYPSASHAAPPPKVLDGDDAGDDGVSSIKSNAHRASQYSTRTAGSAGGYLEPRAALESGAGSRMSRQWFGPRSSWITKAPSSYKRNSKVSQETSRKSSEEMRRRFSRLFDEQLQAQPSDAFRLSPVPPAVEGEKKKLSKSRPWL